MIRGNSGRPGENVFSWAKARGASSGRGKIPRNHIEDRGLVFADAVYEVCQVQKGFIAVPGSSNPDHIAENYDIFNFVLSDGDMATINAMQTGHGNFNMRG